MRYNELLETMSKTAKRYKVCVYPEGGIDPAYELTKEFKTYQGAANYASKQSAKYTQSSSRVEVMDIATDEARYYEDLCRTQEYILGKLYRDGYKQY